MGVGSDLGLDFVVDIGLDTVLDVVLDIVPGTAPESFPCRAGFVFLPLESPKPVTSGIWDCISNDPIPDWTRVPWIGGQEPCGIYSICDVAFWVGPASLCDGKMETLPRDGVLYSSSICISWISLAS